MMSKSQYLKREEAASRLGVSITTVVRWTKAERLKVVYVLGKPRYLAEDIERLLKPGVELEKP